MNKLKSITLGILTLAVLSLTLYSCTNDEVKINDANEPHAFITKSNTSYNYNFSQAMPNGKLIKTEVVSTIPLDAAMTETAIQSSIIANKANITVKCYVDNIIIIPIQVSNGVVVFSGPKYPNRGLCSTCKRDSDGNISDSLDCTTEGVNQCAFYTYQQWSTAHIIAGSFYGEVQAVLTDCVGRNCVGW